MRRLACSAARAAPAYFYSGTDCQHQATSSLVWFDSHCSGVMLCLLQVVCELPGAGACWHLATISVTTQSTGETTWFYAGRWFDGTSGFEALLQSSLQDKREQLFQYQVSIVSGPV